jgi:hypothetical protein
MTAPDPHLSRRDAERLLDTPAEHDSALGWALTAASAPAFPDELRREDAAVAAFHAARLAPPPASRSGFVSPTRLGSRAAARAVVATGAVVALTSGGFALANSAHLPLLPDRASDRATESVSRTPGTGVPTTPGTSSTSGNGPSSSGTGSAGSPTGSAGSSTGSSETPDETATPTPDFKGLCRAFQAADRGDAGSSLGSAAFQALAAEAGGADRIATYCVDLIGPPKETGRPTDKPTPTSKPTDKPTPGKPTDKPTDKPTPTTRPTPTVKPTPTDRPTPTETTTDTTTSDPGSSGGSGNGGSGNGNGGSGSGSTNGNGDKGGTT